MTSGPLITSLAIGSNFMASIGLLNNSILLANLCTKLNTAGAQTNVCDNSEKTIIAFVCLSCGFLMLQVHLAPPPPHPPSASLFHQLCVDPMPPPPHPCQTVVLAFWSRPEFSAPASV